jgi:hypothetical protein
MNNLSRFPLFFKWTFGHIEERVFLLDNFMMAISVKPFISSEENLFKFGNKPDMKAKKKVMILLYLLPPSRTKCFF